MGIARRSALSVRLTLLAGCVLLGAQANAQHYTQTNLVSDEPGVAAVQDAHLINPWGLARSSSSPWWSANNESGTSTLYNTSTTPPTMLGLVVTIPPAPGSTEEHGVPTGTVFNGTPAFELTPGNPARFLFVTEDGTISGWNPAVKPTEAVIMATNPDAVYKGAAIASWRGKWYLYVTNFSERRVDVFDSSFHRVSLSDDDHHDGEEGGRPFVDPRIHRDFSPFNVQNIGGDLYVTYAKRDPATNDDVAGAGLGFVDVYSPGGRLRRRLEHGSWLNAPWGVALAPSDFGTFSHNLLVGQFGSGRIAAYDVATGAFLGLMRNTSDGVLSIEGLWALSFGNGGNAGPLNTLFFTAGPDEEEHGLFGSLTALATEQVLGNGK